MLHRLFTICALGWSGVGGAADLEVDPAGPYQTLEQAVAQAATGDRIVIAPGTYPSMVAFANLSLEFVARDGPSTVLIKSPTDASLGEAIFNVENAELTLRELEIDGGNALGVVEARDTVLTLDTVELHGGWGTNGGLLRVTDCDTAIRSSYLYDGEADVAAGAGKGGLVWATNGSLTIEGSVLDGGRAVFGGLVYSQDTSVTVHDSELSDGLASVGAALYSVADTVEVLRSSFCGCFGEYRAVVYLVDANSALIANTLFYGSFLFEGTVYVVGGGQHDIWNTVFASNVTTEQGAILVSQGATIDLRNTLMWDNVSLSGAPPVVGVSQSESGSSGGYNAYFENVGAIASAFATDMTGQDPGLSQASCVRTDYLPPPDSVLVDAGEPAWLDPDGTRSDIGLFGGPFALEGPGPETTAPGTEPGDDQDGDGVTVDADCDDTDPEMAPGLPEVSCDGRDNDCDPATLDGPDNDGDGHVCLEDCDDEDPSRHLGRAEIPDDGIDQDCDGRDAETVLGGASGLRCGCAVGMGSRSGWLSLGARRR